MITIFLFNAVHIHLNENSNFFNPARLHYNNCIAPSSFISNNPNENQSHFIFCLFRGVDGSYKLLLLVYLKMKMETMIFKLLIG